MNRPDNSLYNVLPNELVHDIGFQVFVERHPMRPGHMEDFHEIKEVASSTLASTCQTWAWGEYVQWMIVRKITPLSQLRHRPAGSFSLPLLKWKIDRVVATVRQDIEETLSANNGQVLGGVSEELPTKPCEFGRLEMIAPYEWLAAAAKVADEARGFHYGGWQGRGSSCPKHDAEGMLAWLQRDAECINIFLSAVRAHFENNADLTSQNIRCVCRHLVWLDDQCLVCHQREKKGITNDPESGIDPVEIQAQKDGRDIGLAYHAPKPNPTSDEEGWEPPAEWSEPGFW